MSGISHESPPVLYWPGNPVSSQEILKYLDNILTTERLNTHQHYAFTPHNSQLFNRSADFLCTTRLCWFDLPSPVTVEAYFDGAWTQRKIFNGDVLVGGYNGFNRVVEPGNKVYGGFSIIFHLHHIRLHYGYFDHGRELANIYYHTLHPASGVLELLRKALDEVIHETGTMRQERTRPILEAIVRQLRYELTSEEKTTLPKNNQLAVRIKNYIEHNFCHAIDCAAVCEALSVNRSYASTVFHATFNMTMKEYLTMLRLETAEVLLASGEDIKVEEAARCCAFSSVSYFVKVFRKRYGITPGEYRNKKAHPTP